ncbi:hypothetical protein AURDEDRAFT_116511, partial [Auricularia subglabra TFB-10046 SS5]
MAARSAAAQMGQTDAPVKLWSCALAPDTSNDPQLRIELVRHALAAAAVNLVARPDGEHGALEPDSESAQVRL